MRSGFTALEDVISSYRENEVSCCGMKPKDGDAEMITSHLLWCVHTLHISHDFLQKCPNTFYCHRSEEKRHEWN